MKTAISEFINHGHYLLTASYDGQEFNSIVTASFFSLPPSYVIILLYVLTFAILGTNLGQTFLFEALINLRPMTTLGREWEAREE